MSGPTFEELLAVIRRASGDDRLSLLRPPAIANTRASVLAVKPRSVRADLNTPAMVRLVESIEDAKREATIGSYLNQAGYPTPPVLLTGSADDELGGAWLLTERASGLAARMRGGRNPVEALRSLWALWQRPAMLANLTAQLHAIDPEPVGRRLEEAGAALDWHDFLWDRASLVRGQNTHRIVDWLKANEPEHSDLVISHGDLHPSNIVVGEDGPQVIDWGIGALAPPARDLACTMFALVSTGSQAPGAARRLFADIGKLLSRRFLQLYRAESDRPVSDEELDWHRVIYALNRLHWATVDDDRAPAAIEDDVLAKRAGRASTVLDREVPLHARIIKEITGADLGHFVAV